MPRGAKRPSSRQFGSPRCALATWLGVDHLCMFHSRMEGGSGRCRSATMMSSMATVSEAGAGQKFEGIDGVQSTR
jgi:hypothetical protein